MSPAPFPRLLVVLLTLALAGCQVPAAVEPVGPTPRQALVEQAALGPVRAVVAGELPTVDAADRDRLVTEAMATGVRGLGVRFTTDPAAAAAPEPHLAVVLDPGPVAPATLACRAPEEVPDPPANGLMQVLAVFCDGDVPLGEARVEGRVDRRDGRRVQRLLWRAANQLFPDDYAETYGFGILPDWFGLGVEGTFGF
jgi:hypothetical protein